MASEGLVLVLTGAGISTASGIPDFKSGEVGWWQGSEGYRPRELATRELFEQRPRLVWSWYLYRRFLCSRATPNPAHLELVRLERELSRPYLLLTQNVDGLHLRAGSQPDQTYEVHGNLDMQRCVRGCSQPSRLDESLLNPKPNQAISEDLFERLRCPGCEGPTRPHVLWFDEYYDEKWFRYYSALEAAEKAKVLIVIGSAGGTRLPAQVAEAAAETAFLINLDLADNPFAQLARSRGGVFLQGPATTRVPQLVEFLLAPEALPDL